MLEFSSPVDGQVPRETFPHGSSGADGEGTGDRLSIIPEAQEPPERTGLRLTEKWENLTL